MKASILFTLTSVTLIFFSLVAEASTWTLDHSTITYTVNHPLKTASGTSAQAKGKGNCEKGRCEFLIAVPVKSFDSGDSNRDLHMLEVTRGGTYPMVIVQTSFDEKTLTHTASTPLSFEIQFSGKKASYRNLPFQITRKDPHLAETKGVITIKLNDFAITPPSLLTLSIKDEVPIQIDAFWNLK